MNTVGALLSSLSVSDLADRAFLLPVYEASQAVAAFLPGKAALHRPRQYKIEVKML